jgi:hypothetical protein
LQEKIEKENKNMSRIIVWKKQTCLILGIQIRYKIAMLCPLDSYMIVFGWTFHEVWVDEIKL